VWTGRAGHGGRSREMCLRERNPSWSRPSLRRSSTGTARALPRANIAASEPPSVPTTLENMWTSIGSTLLAGILAAGTPASPIGPAGSTWVAPLASGLSSVLQGFERPADRFAPGHRGVDLAAAQGTPVRSIGEGTVTHVGEVAGVASVTVDHRAVRSSYLPIDALVSEGEKVNAGQVIGFVSGSHCSVSCLHLGLRRPAWEKLDATVDPYLDPIAWIRRIPVLKPLA
jgi:murein DD-endopeptidase MepM/ murein hydrolase activator NlpD